VPRDTRTRTALPAARPPVRGSRGVLLRAPAARGRPPKQAARMPRLARVAALVAAPPAILAVLVVALCYVKLLFSPIPLTFLIPAIERGAGAELGGRAARIDGAELALSPKGGFELRLRNMRIFETDGDVIASAPYAAIELSGRALWSLRLAPARVDLIAPRVSAGYADDGQLTLRFDRQDETEDGAPPPPVPAKRPPSAAPAAEARIDLKRILIVASERARDGLGAAPYLREIGLRDAIVSLDGGGRATTWTIPRAALVVSHRSGRPAASGSITVASPRGSWGLAFTSKTSSGAETLSFEISVTDFVPGAVAAASPRLGFLETVDVPVSGRITLDLSASGDLLGAKAAFETGKGVIGLPAAGGGGVSIDRGEFSLVYYGAERRLSLLPSTLAWGKSRMTIEGGVSRDTGGDGAAWSFAFGATDGRLAAEEFGGASLKLGEWTAAGKISPAFDAVTVTKFTLAAGDGGVDLSGEASFAADGGARVEGVLRPMSMAAAKTLWPRLLGPKARSWIGTHIDKGAIASGRLRFASGRYLASPASAGGASPALFEMTVEAANLRARPMEGFPAVEIPRATVRLAGPRLEVDIPDAAVVPDGGKRVLLRAGRFSSRDIDADAPVAELVFHTQGALPPVLALLDRAPISLGAQSGLPLDRIDGKIEGDFKLAIPLDEAASAAAIKVEGKARISEGHAKQFIGSYDVQGAAFDFDFSEQAIDARGELLLNGVLAKVNWQRIFDAPPDKQPPLRITGTLDTGDRALLGFDVNHILLGAVPVEVTATRAASGEPLVRARADLTNAEVVFEAVAWRKPPGRPAILECDVVNTPSRGMELANFKVEGDGISVGGRIVLDAQSHLQEFQFPQFSLDVVTRLDVQGTVRPDNVLAVKARGAAFDGRNLFRALFSVGKITEQELKPAAPRAGLEIEAEIDTVIGFSGVSLRNYKATLSKRGDKLAAFSGRGVLDGGKPLTVEMREEKGQPRKLRADSTDAGQVFKLTGFYPNVDGGRVRLEVDLDGRGPAEKTGVLWVEDFRILGDPIVSEVFGGAGDAEPGIGAPRTRRVTRQAFDFDQMRVQFSVGHGQFVVEDSYVRGAVIGASLRGTVDYGAQRVNLGGTYVPLHGLNAALKDFPLFGPLFTGARGEGVFGITFAITGPVADPEVLVNPLSLITPGIFREIFEMTTPNPRVSPRPEKPPRAPSAVGPKRAGARAGGGASKSPQPDGGVAVMDGWSSETLPGTKKQ